MAWIGSRPRTGYESDCCMGNVTRAGEGNRGWWACMVCEDRCVPVLVSLASRETEQPTYECPDCGRIGTHADTCGMFPGERVEHGNRVAHGRGAPPSSQQPKEDQ